MIDINELERLEVEFGFDKAVVKGEVNAVKSMVPQGAPIERIRDYGSLLVQVIAGAAAGLAGTLLPENLRYFSSAARNSQGADFSAVTLNRA